MGLKLFFSCKVYRKTARGWLKYKILSLPVISYIASWYYAIKREKKMEGMSQWERYVADKKYEADSDDFCFKCALLRLEVCIAAEDVDEQKFEQTKADVLSSKVINEPKYKNLKEWVESIDSTEKDYSILEKFISLT